MTTLAVLSPFANYGAGDFLTDDSTFTPPAFARVFVLPTLYLIAIQSGPNAQNVTTTILPPVSGVTPSTPHSPLSSLIGVATVQDAVAGLRQDVALTPYLAAAQIAATPAPPPTTAQVQAAVAPLVGAVGGLAGLDASSRLPVAQDLIRAGQVRRAAKPLVAAAGGSWSYFTSQYIVQDPDDQGGSAEAYEAGAAASVNGPLANLIRTYLVTELGQSSGQATATLSAIWAAAASITF